MSDHASLACLAPWTYSNQKNPSRPHTYTQILFRVSRSVSQLVGQSASNSLTHSLTHLLILGTYIQTFGTYILTFSNYAKLKYFTVKSSDNYTFSPINISCALNYIWNSSIYIYTDIRVFIFTRALAIYYIEVQIRVYLHLGGGGVFHLSLDLTACVGP